jgi:uncharacterized protein YqeY
MQTLKEKLKEDLKVAMKTGNALKKDLIKVVLGEIALEEGRGKAGFFLNDEGVMSILKKFKNNQEVIKEEYEKLQKEVPADTLKEIEILSSYLPQQMSKEEIEVEVSTIISEVGATSMKEMGKVMGAFNAKHAGKADNKIVSETVKNKLNGQS